MINLIAQSEWSGIPIGEHLFAFSPMIAITCTMLAIVACPIVLGRSARIAASIAALGVIVTFILALRVWQNLPPSGVSGFSTRAGAGMLIADNLAVAFQLILLVFLAGVMWLWWMGSADKERNAPEFFILLLGSALGMMLMTATQNLLMIVVAIETASIPSYAIVGFDKKDRVAAEASLKYMVFGAICAAVMLYGASLLYGLVGSLNIEDIARYTAMQLSAGENRLLLGSALLCFLVGIAFKISAVPFHFWCPDAFQGAKIEVTTWLSVVSKAAGLVLLGRLVLAFCRGVDTPVEMSLIAPLAWTLGIMAAVTCTVGNFAAYVQDNVKRLLAYSSIAHAGYMMMALAVFVHPRVPGFEAGMTALVAYVIIYLFMNLGAFAVTAIVVWDTGSDRIENFSGLMRRAPSLAIPMIICLVSLVGLPPLAGFIGKWWLLIALGRLSGAGNIQGASALSSLGWILIIVAVLNTLVSLYYYMRIVVLMCLRDDGREPVNTPIGGAVLANICGAALLLLFVFAHPLKQTADRFSRGLFIGTSATAATKTSAPQIFGVVGPSRDRNPSRDREGAERAADFSNGGNAEKRSEPRP
jgi:NADH-quinone oxidoreductase subunit N